MNTLKELVQELWAYIEEKYNEKLPEPEHKLAFWIAATTVYSLLFYLIAMLDIGIRNHDTTPSGMIALYLLDRGKSYPWLIWLVLSTTIFAGLIYLFFHFFLDTEEGRNFKMSDSDVYGNAREINMEEIQKVCDITLPENTDLPILGMAPGSNRKILGARPDQMDNKNIAIVGTPGAGKTYTICLPFIVQAILRRESIVMTDTKGELFAKTVEFARANGYVIRRLDLRDPIKSHGWNVLKEMHRDTVRTEIFVNTVIANCDIASQYVGFAQNLLKAVALYVERNSSIPEEEKNIGRVFRMISLDAQNLDFNFEQVSMRQEMVPALTSYNSFMLATEALRGNIINNLASNLGVLSSDEVQAMLSKDEIDLTLPGKVPCIYYVSMSDQDDSMKFIASLFFAFLFRNLVDYADSRPSQKLDVPCTVLFEEFAQVNIPKIDKQLSSVRSRDISIIMIIQTIGQLKKDYRFEWTTMLADCPIQICLAANDEETAKHFEEKCGECTIEARTDQHNTRSFWGTGQFSTGYGKRPYRTANEIRKIPKFHSLIVWQRYDTLVTRTFGINKHPAYKHMPQIDAFTKVPITDYAARNYIRQYEEYRVATMNQWIAQGGQPMWYCHVPGKERSGPMAGKKPPKFKSYPMLEKEALQLSAEKPEINRQYTQSVQEKNLSEAYEIMAQIQQKQGKNVPLSTDDQEPAYIIDPAGTLWEAVEIPEDTPIEQAEIQGQGPMDATGAAASPPTTAPVLAQSNSITAITFDTPLEAEMPKQERKPSDQASPSQANIASQQEASGHEEYIPVESLGHSMRTENKSKRKRNPKKNTLSNDETAKAAAFSDEDFS